MFSSAFSRLLIIPLLIALGVGSYFLLNPKKPHVHPDLGPPKTINVLGKEKVKYPNDYTIVMIGDSMTETLGNSDELKEYLSKYYKGKTFEVLNYGFGSTNILSVMDRIASETTRSRVFRPIETIEYDLVLVESFGENPLSQYGRDEGLRRQNEELDKIVAKLKETNPRGQIVFVSTISPNKKIFGKTSVELTPEKRAEWVDERVAYLKNHIEYARSHNIPIINIYEKSLKSDGDGNEEYINNTDYIHPSPKGIIFISHEIADFIYNKKIFPHE